MAIFHTVPFDMKACDHSFQAHSDWLEVIVPADIHRGSMNLECFECFGQESHVYASLLENAVLRHQALLSRGETVKAKRRIEPVIFFQNFNLPHTRTRHRASADIQKCLEDFLPDHDVGVSEVALSEDRGCRTVKILAAESNSAQVGRRQSLTRKVSRASIRKDDAQDLVRQRGGVSFAGPSLP